MLGKPRCHLDISTREHNPCRAGTESASEGLGSLLGRGPRSQRCQEPAVAAARGAERQEPLQAAGQRGLAQPGA